MWGAGGQEIFGTNSIAPKKYVSHFVYHQAAHNNNNPSKNGLFEQDC